MQPGKTTYSPSIQKKNSKQKKRTDNTMPALLELIFIDYYSYNK